MIHVVTISQSDGRVRVIPVDADDFVDAVVRAAKLLPFVTVGWTATVEAQSESDCIKNTDLLVKLITAAHLDLCHESDKNGYVSDEAFDAGVEEYHRAYYAVWVAVWVIEECDDCGGAIVGGCCDNCMGADV